MKGNYSDPNSIGLKMVLGFTIQEVYINIGFGFMTFL